MSKIDKAISALQSAVSRGSIEKGCKDGWYSIHQIQQELKMRWVHNASTRAYNLYRRGLLERRQFIGRQENGNVIRTYMYKPIKPCKTVLEVVHKFMLSTGDKIPKGWHSVSDLAAMMEISHQAVLAMSRRKKMKFRLFRTARGLSGLHYNKHFHISDMRKAFTYRLK